VSSANQVTEVDRLIAETQALLDGLAERIAPLAAEQARAQERLRLLKELRSTFPASDTPEIPAVAPRRTSLSTRDRVQSCVKELLEEAGIPLHTNDLHRLFLERGWPVPGAGRPGNISAHLTVAEGIYSPRRGYWARGDSSRRPTKTTRKPKTDRRK